MSLRRLSTGQIGTAKLSAIVFHAPPCHSAPASVPAAIHWEPACLKPVNDVELTPLIVILMTVALYL